MSSINLPSTLGGSLLGHAHVVPDGGITMGSEHPDRQSTTPADEPSKALSVPRWAVITVLLVLFLPVLIMSSMVLVVGSFGPPMHGGMATYTPGIFPVIGVIPPLLVLGVIYGVYRLYAANTR